MASKNTSETQLRLVDEPESRSRRKFLIYGLAIPIGVAASIAGSAFYYSRTATHLSQNRSPQVIPKHRVPVSQPDTEAVPSLVRWYPHLDYTQGGNSRLQIANVLNQDFPELETEGHDGIPGEYLYRVAKVSERFIIPWAPLFPKTTPYLMAPNALRNHLGLENFHIKDEGDERLALFGNKARKYEYALPNAALSGAERLFTFGSLGSNHCTYLTLAANYANYKPDWLNGAGLPVILNLYPQKITEGVIYKLRSMLALGAHVHFMEHDPQVGLGIAGARLNEKLGFGKKAVYIPPGGSTPLTVLGHIDALLELAEQLSERQSPPPDYLFIPLGSGATAIGLMLGCYLLGWPTKVVGTTTQDKSIVTRLIVNGDPNSPFLIANAMSLMASAIGLLNRLGIKPRNNKPLTAGDVFQNNGAYDNTTWKPAYGVASKHVTEAMTLALEDGIKLDPTFSGKAFSTLISYAEAGRLKGKQVLFWNTHHPFSFRQIPGFDQVSLTSLPEALQQRIFDFSKQKGIAL